MGGCLDQSNFPGSAVPEPVGNTLGATVVLPERGGSPALLPSGAGSAARTWNARLKVPAPRQSFSKDRYLTEKGFEASWQAGELGKLGSVISKIPVNIL